MLVITKKIDNRKIIVASNNMPGIQDMIVLDTSSNKVEELPLPSTASFTTEDKCSNPVRQDRFSKDMENLVSEIKENLKLSNFKVKNNNNRLGHRSRPYSIPSRSWNESCNEYECVAKSSSSSCHCPSSSRYNKVKGATDDPYEMLQELLKDGSLIKEAVKRLQKGLSPKQRYFYDESEDGSRSSPHPNLDLVC